MKKLGLFATLTLLFASYSNSISNACTRVVYKGPNNTIITARSMDWKDEIAANIWVLPRGIERNGEVGSTSIKWKAKYGSVVATAWDIATADGLNEKGLVSNVLWLAESTYPKFVKNGSKAGLSIALWAQYVLDNFATVQEAVDQLKKEEFAIVSSEIPGTDKFTTLHLSLSDATGDNAIFEYIDGKLVIHHAPTYTVMTNSPVFDQQLAISKYWESIPGTIMLPGTNRAADRFARASYYIQAIPQTDNAREAIASVFSVIRNASVPFGISSETEPNISSTRWRSVSDHKNLTYFFETVLTPNTFWVDLKKFDLSNPSNIYKLDLGNFKTYNGETSSQFVKTKAFAFLGL
ncbi:linear amide C-N hydrolase [Sphingobacterium sp. MYb382]|uniref:linear amide C-N hydrolase n=1 Tax=Sphingobacterium sp. MYb382 TaxID=2745278 RepID=UPI0030A14EFF